MSFWSAVVAIVLIGAIASVLRARYHASAGITEDMMGNQTIAQPQNTAKDEATEREVKELRERVKVLERIATSDRASNQIASEIEALRDKPN